LKRATRDENVDVRTDAAVALVRLVVGEDYGPALIRMLSASKWSNLILYRHLGSLAEDQPLYAPFLLPALNSTLPALRSEVRERISGLPPEAADVFWKTAVDAEDLGQQYAAMHALALMEDTAMPTLAQALDGPNRRLAARILEDMAGDKEQRTADEWKAWMSNRFKETEDDPSETDRTDLLLAGYRDVRGSTKRLTRSYCGIRTGVLIGLGR
jgi:hypothetical protein